MSSFVVASLGFLCFNALWWIKSCCLGSKISSYKVTHHFPPHMSGFNFIRNKHQSFVHQGKKRKENEKQEKKVCVVAYSHHLNFLILALRVPASLSLTVFRNTGRILTTEYNFRNHHFYILGSRLVTCIMNNTKRIYIFSQMTPLTFYMNNFGRLSTRCQYTFIE